MTSIAFFLQEYMCVCELKFSGSVFLSETVIYSAVLWDNATLGNVKYIPIYTSSFAQFHTARSYLKSNALNFRE